MFACGLFYGAFSETKTRSIQGGMKGWQVLWIGKDLEGSGCGLILRHSPGIRLERLRKTTKTSVRMGSPRAEMWTWALPTTKQECWPFDYIVKPHRKTCGCCDCYVHIATQEVNRSVRYTRIGQGLRSSSIILYQRVSRSFRKTKHRLKVERTDNECCFQCFDCGEKTVERNFE
jgi:hypothetical protein